MKYPESIRLKIELPLYTKVGGVETEIGTIVVEDDFPITILDAMGAHATLLIGKPADEAIETVEQDDPNGLTPTGEKQADCRCESCVRYEGVNDALAARPYVSISQDADGFDVHVPAGSVVQYNDGVITIGVEEV